MYDYAQYHKEDERGPYRPGTFRIVTNKRLNALVGSRVWVISGADKPRHYCLCETFIVDKVCCATNDTKYYEASGRGTAFTHSVRIDGKVWFKRMLRSSANFSRGLHRITDVEVLSGLQQILHEKP